MVEFREDIICAGTMPFAKRFRKIYKIIYACKKMTEYIIYRNYTNMLRIAVSKFLL